MQCVLYILICCYSVHYQNSVEEIIATLQGLVNSNQEELKVLQTVMLLSSSTDMIKGPVLTNVSVTCRKTTNHLKSTTQILTTNTHYVI